MKVLIIPEDPTLDQYILKPIVGRIFADLGKSPRIDVLSNPRLRLRGRIEEWLTAR